MARHPRFALHARRVPYAAAGVAPGERIRQPADHVPDDYVGRGVPPGRSRRARVHGGAGRGKSRLQFRNRAGRDDRNPRRGHGRRPAGRGGAVFQHRDQRPYPVRHGRRPGKSARGASLRPVRYGRETHRRHDARGGAQRGHRSRHVRRTGRRPGSHGVVARSGTGGVQRQRTRRRAAQRADPDAGPA